MLKDAALTIIDLELLLAKHGLTLQDAHPWNILFDGCRPLYVDFGSIVPAKDGDFWPAYDEFCRFFLFPLELISHGQARIARWLLRDYNKGVLQSEVQPFVYKASVISELRDSVDRNLKAYLKRFVPQRLRPTVRELLGYVEYPLARRFSSGRALSRIDFLERVRLKVDNTCIPFVETSWTNYYDACFPSFEPCDEWSAKHKSVYRVLSASSPHSILDVGSNRGWFSQLAALLGSQVVALDVDDSASAQLYFDVKQKQLAVLPLTMDFTNPSPGYGICNEWLAPATERVRAEMVLALALVHHLVFKQNLKFDQIVKGLSAFSTRWLLVEFIPREDRYVKEWWSENFSWYTLDNFITALKKEFSTITLLPSDPEPRTLVLCER
jgi:hypothetical protein